MTPEHARGVLATTTDSLRDVHSLRDFIIAVEVGAKTATAMLDDIERSLMRILRSVNQDAEP